MAEGEDMLQAREIGEAPFAFSLERVIFHGVNVVRQAPAPVLGAALLAALAELLPIAVANTMSLVGNLAFSQGSTQNVMLSLASSVVQITGLLLAVPLIPLFSYGSMSAVARWAAGEPLTLAGIATSFIPAIRGFLYRVLVGLVRALLGAVFLVPAVGLVIFALIGGESTMVPLVVAAGALVLVYSPVAVFFIVRFAVGDVIAAVDDDGWPVAALVRTWRMTGSIAGFVTIGVLTLVGCCADVVLGGLLGSFFIGIPMIAAVHAVLRSGMALAWLEASRSPEDLAQMPYFRDLTSEAA